MTTSDHGSRSAARHAAGAGHSPSSPPPLDAATRDDTSAATRPSDSVTGPPDDIQELRQEIERTREQLGDTVQQLAAKTDVQARARDKAVEMTRKVRGKASQAQAEAAAVGAPVWEATPEPVRQAVAKGASTIRQRRGPLAVAASALVGGYLAVRWWRRR
jgi:hypothetical protein